MSDAAFVHQIDQRMPRDAAVFELPQVPFPEGYNEAAYNESTTEHGGFPTSYELLRGYLHSTSLRWSFGAMKGREADWASELVTKPLPLVIDAAAADGFDGLWVDLHGYAPHNRSVVLTQSQRLTGSAPLVSRLHDLEFFDLRRLRAAQSGTQTALLRADTLHPLRTTCTPTGLALYNPSARPRSALLTFTLVPGGEGKTVRIRYPDGALDIQQPARAGSRVVKRLVVAPGTERVRFSYVGPLATPRIPVDGPSVVAPDFSDTALTSLGAGQAGFMVGLAPPPCIQTVLPLQDQLLAPNPASSG